MPGKIVVCLTIMAFISGIVSLHIGTLSRPGSPIVGVTIHQVRRASGGLSCLVPRLKSESRHPLCRHTILLAKKSGVRPTIDDIDKISRGKAAQKRGTGSRAVPHRLNEKERIEFDLAKKRKFVSLRGTGWRSERGDSPLANIYRNLCDALNQPCISVRRGIFINDDENTVGDEVIVDFSPLRKYDVIEERDKVLTILKKYSSVQGIEDTSDITNLGFPTEELPDMTVEPIWRLPVYSVSATFLQRAEAKAFAETVAGAI